jgi:hypothetical protein
MTRCRKKALRRYYYDYEGRHEGPMHYIVRLLQPEHEEAWLIGKFVDGEPEMRLLCHVSANSGGELHECAEALWREGAHPSSVLELWWGESPGSKTPDRMMRATLCAAVPKAWWQRCLV